MPWWLRIWICLQCRKLGLDPWVGMIPWRRKRPPTPIFLPEKSHRGDWQGYNPWGQKRAGHDWVSKHTHILMWFVLPFAFPQKRAEKLELLLRVGRDGPLCIPHVFSWWVWENLPTPILCLLLLLFLFLSFHTHVHTYTCTRAYIHTSAWSHVSRIKWFRLMMIYQYPAHSIYPSIYLSSLPL